MTTRRRHISKGERASRVVLVAAAASSLVMFVVFHAMGCADVPLFDEYSAASAMIDVFIWFVIALTTVALAAVLVSAVLRMRRVGGTSAARNGINGRIVALVTMLFSAAVVAVSLAVSSSDAIETSGIVYDDSAALRAAGAAVGSCAVLLVAALCSVVVASVRRLILKNG